jgi:hypothetical protein
MKGNTTMNNDTNNFDPQEFKTKFDMLTRISMQFVDKLPSLKNSPKFVDTAERSLNLYKNMNSFDMSGIENWHLPFPRLSLIASSSIIDVLENENDSTNKYMNFVIFKTDTKQDFTGSVEIHRNGEKPQDTPIPQKHFQTSYRFDTWSITITLKVVHTTNRKLPHGEFLHGYYSNEDDKSTVCGNMLSLVNYFHPFCVDKEMFVVESQAASKEKGKIRTRGKSTYSVMHVAKILKRFTPTGRSGQPLTKGYPRRAHIRKYRHDRWVNMQGQTITVKSTWVGPKTVLSEGRLYKVHTDIY